MNKPQRTWTARAHSLLLEALISGLCSPVHYGHLYSYRVSIVGCASLYSSAIEVSISRPLLLFLAPLLNLFYYHPPALFWQLTCLAPFVAPKQKIYQNVHLDLTRYAIIQIFEILICRKSATFFKHVLLRH